MLGAMPLAGDRQTVEAECHVLRTTRLFQSAGQNFNRGQRAFFFPLGYLGWFAGPGELFASTTAGVILMWRGAVPPTAPPPPHTPAPRQTTAQRPPPAKTPT